MKRFPRIVQVRTLAAGILTNLVIFGSVALAQPATAETPQVASALASSAFRGIDGTGNIDQGSIPSTWTDADYRWRRNLGSRDVGSPVVAGDKVFLLVSKPASQEISVEAIGLTTGKLLWSREFAQQPHPLHKRNKLASCTPAANATHVYVAWSEPEHTYLKCLTVDGEEVWSRDFGSWTSQHGFGTSPRIVGDMVLLLNDQQADELPAGETPGESRMIAVNRLTGADIWTTPLTATRACYGVPAVYESTSGQTQIIDANTGNGLFGVDASSGKLLWNLEVFDKRCCSCPIVVGNLAIGTCGSGGGGNRLIAVRIPDQPGAKPEEVYSIDRFAPYVPTPVLKSGRLYLVADSGIASSVDAKTGETIWSKRIGGNFGASPIAVGDKLLIISLEGKATILSTGDEFKELGQVDLGGPVGATPVYAEGNLIIRVDDELRCIGGETT